MRQGSLRPALLVAAAVAIVASTALAATTSTIRGTARANTLRGTAKADTIYGLGGNDTLYGLGGDDTLAGGPGNDLIVGGAGADRISCGAGTDTVRRDARDTVAKDCERVTGPTGAKPTPPPPQPACSNGTDDDGDGKIDSVDPGCSSPTDTDETDPAPQFQPGTYCGFTEQGPGLCVTTDGTVVTKFETSAIVDCTDGSRWTWTVTFSQRGVPVLTNGSFEYSYSGPLSSSGGSVSNVQQSEFIKGTFTSDGKATGTLAMTSMSFDYQGRHYSCTQGAVSWHVARQG